MPRPSTLLRRPFLAAAALALLAASCTSIAPAPERPVPPGQSLLQGWHECSGDVCGRTFVSAYSTFEFVRLDDKDARRAVDLVVPPGRHWVEANHTWGGGVLSGIGTHRNYGFEFDFLPDRRYAVRNAPVGGCVVPGTRGSVNARTLQLEEQLPSGQSVLHTVPAIEYCMSSSERAGTCRSTADCRSGESCSTIGGTTGFGLCGMRR